MLTRDGDIQIGCEQLVTLLGATTIGSCISIHFTFLVEIVKEEIDMVGSQFITLHWQLVDVV